MGYEIVYCTNCSMQIRGTDLEKRLAIRVDDLAHCAKCAPAVLKTLPPEKADEVLGRIPPPIRKASTTRIPKVQQSKTSGRLKAQAAASAPPPPPPPPPAKKGLLIGSAAAAVILVGLVAILMMNSGSPPPEPKERETPKSGPTPPKPLENLEAAKALADLEILANSGADPLEVLIRCDEIKAVVRGTAQEPAWKTIQEKAAGARKVKDADQTITRGLEQVKSLRKYDVRFDKRKEVESLLERMKSMGGSRQAEVQAVIDDYKRDADEATLRLKDLVAWYRFTIAERLGSDDSGRENNAISVGGAELNSKFPDGGPGARFSGNGAIAIPVAVRDDFTIAFWMRSRQGPMGNTQWFEGPGLVDAEVPGVTDDFGTGLLRGKFAFGVGKPDLTLSSRSDVCDGRWRHVAASRDSRTGQMQVYVDGTPEGIVSGPKGPRSAPNRMTIGAIQTGTNPFVGELDDIRIYSRVLPDAEIAALAKRRDGR